MFIDYNLYGMNMLNVGAVKFRAPSVDQDQGVAMATMHDTASSSFNSSALDDSARWSSFCTKRWDIENIPRYHNLVKKYSETPPTGILAKL